jgi:hypothetical protein
MAKRSQFFITPLSEEQPPRTGTVVLLNLISLYLPFAWILFREMPSDSQRWNLLKALPTLPGAFLRNIPGLESLPPGVTYSLMGIATLVAFIILVLLGRHSRGWLILSALATLGFASWNSWLIY